MALFVINGVLGSTLLNTKDRVLGSAQDLNNKALLKWIAIVVGILFFITMVFVCLYVSTKSLKAFLEMHINMSSSGRALLVRIIRFKTS